jgi:hypothetical protein
VSLILVPVFARPTKDQRWERARVGTAIAVAPGHAAVGLSVAVARW